MLTQTGFQGLPAKIAVMLTRSGFQGFLSLLPNKSNANDGKNEKQSYHNQEKASKDHATRFVANRNNLLQWNIFSVSTAEPTLLCKVCNSLIRNCAVQIIDNSLLC